MENIIEIILKAVMGALVLLLVLAIVVGIFAFMSRNSFLCNITGLGFMVIFLVGGYFFMEWIEKKII